MRVTKEIYLIKKLLFYFKTIVFKKKSLLKLVKNYEFVLYEIDFD